jgi:hypothetical protein
MEASHATLALAVAAGLALAGPAAAGDDAAAARRHFDPATRPAYLLAAGGAYAVWQASEMDAGTAGRIAPSFNHRFFRQRADQPLAELVAEDIDVSAPYRAATRDDGSLLLASRRQFQYFPRTGSPVRQDLGWYEPMAIYPDGLLAEDWSKNDGLQAGAVVFLPFADGCLQLADTIQILAAAPGDPMAPNRPPAVCRSGDTFAWISGGDRLVRFDFKARSRSQTRLSRAIRADPGVTAFDAKIAVCDGGAYDVATGRPVGIISDDPGGTPRSGVFAVRHGLGYYFHADGLYAVDFASGGVDRRLHDARPCRPWTTEAGVNVWDGRRWTSVAWVR